MASAANMLLAAIPTVIKVLIDFVIGCPPVGWFRFRHEIVPRSMPARSFAPQKGLVGQIAQSTALVCRPHHSPGPRGKLWAARRRTFMASQPQSTAPLAFRALLRNLSAGQLLKSGVRIRLSGQPFQVLLTLLAHPGDVVTNEQLHELIWKKGTFVDFEHGLHAAVNKLRRALGDSAENPRYIETVPGRGYRFIGAMGRQPVPISGSLGTPAHPPLDGANLSRRLSKLRQRWWIAATVALVLIALGTWAASRFRQAPAEEDRKSVV